MRLPLAYKKTSIARTLGGNKIELYCYGTGGVKFLLLGGVHGDESEGFLLAERFREELQNKKIILNKNIRLYICERVNPDGCENLRRTNHSNVDLNRNLPSLDWQGGFKNLRYYPGKKANSEIETSCTIKLINKIKPKLIISLHSYEKPMINYNGPCKEFAEIMSVHNSLPPKSDIGYPTPGSLGTYAGLERNIPTITLEIFNGQKPREVWRQHSKALVHVLEYAAKNKS